MPADNTDHLITAARRRHELTRSKAIQALRELEANGTSITFDSVARHGQISRSWLYTQADLRTEIERLREIQRRSPQSAVPARQRASEESLLRRLEAANQRNRQLLEENRRLRRQLAHALGDQRAIRAEEPRPSRRASTTIGPC
ncbi:DUF6262 family protein [Actinacidiphila soli]|uniref:DUF6262 family protein n=1 Tax=Actinacidiphila soli TaxID=2487275 RepID=UPI000FCBD2D1|nr:DUF6262 family protein [Actinacidiphila soli]